MAKAHKEGQVTIATNGTLPAITTTHRNSDGSSQSG